MSNDSFADKIKVLFITPLLNKMGGAEKNLCDIAECLDRHKFSPHVLAFQGEELTGKLEKHGIPVAVNGVTKLFSRFALRRGIELFRFLKAEQIQVVVTYHHDADIWGGMVAWLAGTPVIISSRRDMGYQLGQLQVWFYRLFSFIFDAFIAPSQAVKQEIQAREWIESDKIEVIHNGVDLSAYSGRQNIGDTQKRLGIDGSKIIIGMAAAFRPIKGHLYLVEAVNLVVGKYPDIQVVMVGYKETDYFEHVQRRITKLNLQDYFIFTGDRQDIPKWLSAFDIFVTPSVNEGFPNAVVEAMAQGLPVVASDGGGTPEAVEDRRTGLLFTSEDSQSLADALQLLIGDKDLRQRMGSAGREKVERDFPLDKMIEENQELYEYHLGKPSLWRRIVLWGRGIKTYYVKKYIKLLLSCCMYYSGWCFIYKKFLKSGKGVIILTYHSINKVTLRSLELEQDPANFEQQMLYLKNNYHILSLEEFTRHAKEGRKYPKHSVLITFDDGYKDNYTNAYPVLKKLGIPAVIFLTTGPIERQIPLLHDVLRYSILNTRRKILDLKDWGMGKYILYRDEIFMADTIREIVGQGKKLPNEKLPELMEDILERLSIGKGDFLNASPYLAWDEVKDMSQNKIEFGAHTTSHQSLGWMPAEQAREEILTSRRIIEAQLNKQITTFAYPFGGSGDYSDEVSEVLKENAYDCAFTLAYEDGDYYQLGRKMVDSHMTARGDGMFCKALFECEMLDMV